MKSMESSLIMELTLILRSTKDFLRKDGRTPLGRESNPPWLLARDMSEGNPWSGIISFKYMSRSMVWWLKDETRVQKVLSLNPGTGYWMDIFHINLL